MLDIDQVLDDCFRQLSLEYEIEKSVQIPQYEASLFRHAWRMILQANLFGKIEDVEVYIGFPHLFPYIMPYVIIVDNRLCLLPHISYKTRKICLYEDDIVYDTHNIEGLIRDNIKKTRIWLETYTNRNNTDEYSKEIKSYWNQQYDGEEPINSSVFLIGDIPKETCKLKGILFSEGEITSTKENIIVICSDNNQEKTIGYLKSVHRANDLEIMFVSSMTIPDSPPYIITGKNLDDWIKDREDKEKVKEYINLNYNEILLFPIGLKNACGGVFIPKQVTNRKGFRRGALTAHYMLTGSYWGDKNKKLKRIFAQSYTKNRIAERTAGKLMEPKCFLVAGLGSIGSNLCYYLNGYNNASFILVDSDELTLDNIGRHLLGFDYLKQNKAKALAHYLKSYRPDRNIITKDTYFQVLKYESFPENTILFVCTGDLISEQWLILNMINGTINFPVFILWLEPYAISGIMIYVNPNDKSSLSRLLSEANIGFPNYSLISKDEYEDSDKLIKQDAGCNGRYALYSANDVTMFLSAMFQHIDKLLSSGQESRCYRWIGNIEIAKEKQIKLETQETLVKNTIQTLDI